MINWSDLQKNQDGLIPAIVQDYETSSVLMLGYINKEALELTTSTGFVHFWSRSRQQLWKKGEVSGNVLEVRAVDVDCDLDTLLIKATPAGPVCHTGEANCFAVAGGQFGYIDQLWETIEQRAMNAPTGSYVAELLDAGPDKAGRKLVEEATEVLITAKNHQTGVDDDRRLAEELGDVIFHLLVLIKEREIDPALIMEELRERSGDSPITE